MLENIKYLSVQLPEDIRRQLEAGYFSKAVKLIDRRLEGELPLALRKCLELQKAQLPIWEAEYPISYEEAVSVLCLNIRDFTGEEFEELIEQGVFDWIYRAGKMYFIRPS